MEEPLTEDLLDELRNAPSAEDYLARHAGSTRVFADYLNELLDERGLERKEVVREAGIDATYGWQLFKGKRKNPSRDIVLALAFALGCSLRETDRLLQAAGVSRLYVKERRDAIVIFCLDQHGTLEETNKALYRMGERTIGGN